MKNKDEVIDSTFGIQHQKEQVPEWAKALIEKVNDISEGDDLEQQFDMADEKKRSQMLDLDPERTDSFGDSIELVTKSRLKDYGESYQIARNFVVREYHTMEGNRYGKHSKLIPVYDDYGIKNKIDMVWFSGSKIKVVNVDTAVLEEDEEGNLVKKIVVKPYYKVRLLVYDILAKKLLLTRIPTKDGAARQEEINHIGAEKSGQKWVQDQIPMNPMKPISYPGGQNRATMKNVGEMVFETQ